MTDAFERLISGDRRLSRAELADRVLRAAAGFDALGVGEGSSIALLMRNDFAFFEASLAAIRLGAYAVPINWHFKADEVGYILRDCDARVLVVHADLLPAIQDAIPAGTACLVVQTPPEVCVGYRIDPALARVPPGATDWDLWLASHAPHAAAPRRPTYSMIYTSGTTGNPKGVRRHAPSPDDERKTEELRRAVYGFREGIVSALPGPLYHSAPNSFGLRAARDAARTILMPRFDAEELLSIIERHRVTHMFMVPTMFVRLLKLPELVARVHHPCRRALSGRREARHDRVVGSDPQRILRRHRERPGDAVVERGFSGASRHGGAGRSRRDRSRARREWQ